MSQSILDLTQSPGAEIAAVRSALDSLGVGEPLTVVTKGRPSALLKDLIAERWGVFDWAQLSEHGGVWRSELRRRDGPPARTLREFLTADHARCDAWYAEAMSAAQSGDLTGAKAAYGCFDLGMRRHFAMEEEGFFPQFDERAGFTNEGPTEAMRMEHTQMRGLLDEMNAELGDGNLDRFLAAGETLLILMEQHNVKEEQMLYEFADEIFSGEVESLIKRLLLF